MPKSKPRTYRPSWLQPSYWWTTATIIEDDRPIGLSLAVSPTFARESPEHQAAMRRSIHAAVTRFLGAVTRTP